MNFNQNNLSKETSPYLLQHKDNPIWWQSWSDEVLNHAQKNNKPIIISVGYSACHWCHVMERESFEDKQIADIMNENFVCIKVDREERPDVDGVYMSAVQAINGQGGWPLNCFAMPDQSPVFGGTYFPKDKWIQVLNTLMGLFKNEPEKAKEYAKQIIDALKQNQQYPNSKIKVERKEIELAVTALSKDFDRNWGGFLKAPKFMTPIVWDFSLYYGHKENNEEILTQLKTTLDRMSWGGLFDQIGGGFTRYSVDVYWKIPHFEKMLYDNAQLLSLYSNGYKKFKDKNYKQTIEMTAEWLFQDMLDQKGGFYSALDADSDGEEGNYYVWKEEELKNVLGQEYPLFSKYYNIGNFSLWEEGKNVLMRLEGDPVFCIKNKLDLATLQSHKKSWREKLLSTRDKRTKPGLDDKIITAWNALTVTGLCDAFTALGNRNYLDKATNTLNFLIENQCKKEILYRNYKNGKTTIAGFLDDYALFISANIKLYETNFNEKYILLAKKWIDITIENFFDKDKNLFFYKSKNDTALVSDTLDTYDTVIPSSNGVMLDNLIKIYQFFGEEAYSEIYKGMIYRLKNNMVAYPAGYAQWLLCAYKVELGLEELVINSNNLEEVSAEIQKEYHPQIVFAATSKHSSLPIVKSRYKENEEAYYHCKNKTCELPVNKVENLNI